VNDDGYESKATDLNSVSRWLAGSSLTSFVRGGVNVGKVLAEGGSQFPGVMKSGSNTSESFGFHGNYGRRFWAAGQVSAQRRSGAGGVDEC